MKEVKHTKKKQKKKMCMITTLKDKNELFMITNDNWNAQDARAFIMNADFRQMDSARDKR